MRDDLADRAEFEAEHVVEEDLAVPIGFREAVMGGMQFLVVRTRIDVERIELGMQVPAHAIGADQHDGVNGIARRLQHVGLVDGTEPLASAFALILSPTTFSTCAQLPSMRGHQIAVGGDRPVGLFPRCAPGALLDSLLVVLQCAEERLPLGIDRGGILLEARVEVLDVRCVRPIEESGVEEGLGWRLGVPWQYSIQMNDWRPRQIRGGH